VEASIKGVTAPPEPNVEVEDEEDTTLAQQALQEGKDVMLNDDNVIVDKRQLLGAGLNVAKKPKFGTFMSLSDSDPRVQQRQQEYEEYKRKKLAESAAKRSGRGGETERERMSREVERQMLERKQQEEEEEKKKEEEFKQKLQKRTSDETAMSAKERYLARKRQKAGAQS
jgi:coiled-coil domain-containing protein 55